MTIMDARFGGEIITKKGRIYKFDDAHCIGSFIKSGVIKQEDIGQTLFANYQRSNSFLDTKVVQFVVSEELKSPMNSNAAAFENKTTAEQKAKETTGTIKTWDELLSSL